MCTIIFVSLIAPIITGVIIALFTHWLNNRKK
ncbi:type I toxin-antitoxin system Fst family toxin [Mammaliicoccus sciuri]|nr:type I toxin-antitoxin system Fst family toxin [Mammaliicoccus sciuri]MEB7784214.1 type I toxin-antitoxin system Fst family toxin [Mammaliicoccus sciuri]